jgi:TonB family protein
MRLLGPIAVTCLALVAGAGAEAPAARPLPGNTPCAYPAQAQKDYIAGPVHFVVQVRPDGTAESVEVTKVPVPGVGFEDAIRACLSQWRFEPAPAGAAGLRRHEGRLRFRIDVAEEAAIRALMEALAAAWNAGEKAALEDLSLQPADSTAIRPDPRPPLEAQLGGKSGEPRWRIDLESDVEHIRFMKPDVIAVRQPYRRQALSKQAGPSPTQAELAVIDAMAVKGSRGWRFLRIAPSETAWLGAVRVGGKIREPRKVKDARPRYPEAAKELRIQGGVVVECLITAEGKVTNVRVVRGLYKILDDAAIEAVRQWEYTPTLLEGVPVPVIMTVVINFRLNPSLTRTDEGFSADR